MSLFSPTNSAPWGENPRFPGSPGPWVPAVVKAGIGFELVTVFDTGVSRLGPLSGVELSTALDAGVAVLPDLSGREPASVVEPSLLGGWQRAEVSASSEFGSTSWWRTDGSVAEDSGFVAFATSGDELATIGDQGSGSFGWRADVAVQYETPGNYALTIWPSCKTIDLVVLSGGASGQSGEGGLGRRGNGGNAGSWQSTTVTRGTHVPWTAASLYVTVGAGGERAANSDWAGPNSGGNSSVKLTAESDSFAEAPGGSGTNGSNQSGGAPGNHTFNGITYTGGAAGTGNGNTGGSPGGGGSGGNGGAFGSRTRGGEGGAGRVWIRQRF